VYQGQGRLRSPKGVGIAPIEGAAELLEREPNLQSDLIALNLAILDRTAHLRDFEPAEIRSVPEALLIALSIALEMLCSEVPTTSTTL